MNKKIRILFIFAALLTSLACLQTTSSATDLSGEYSVNGTNFDGSSYQGEATITKAADGSYIIVMGIAGETQTATGTLSGNTFTTRWEGGPYVGDAVYILQPDGSLVGTWTMDGVDGQGTETLTPK